MTKCSDKLSNTCGSKMSARCVDYEGTISDNSDLKDESCVSIHDTTEDLYEIIDKLFDIVNLEALGDNCLNYNEEEAGKPKVREVLIKIEEELCSLKEALDNIKTQNGFDLSDIDTKCLQDPCNNSTLTVPSLLQLLIDKVCELDSENNNNV